MNYHLGLPLGTSASPRQLVLCMASYFGLCCSTIAVRADETNTTPDVGVRFQPPATVFLKNAHIVVSAEQSLESGSVLVRDGKILAIGKHLAEPAGAEVIDCSGKYLYPAFVDAFVEFDANASAAPAAYWNSNVTPERRMDRVAKLEKPQLEGLRKAGVGLVLAAPKDGIIKGQSCILTTADAPLAEVLVKSDVFQHIRMYPNRGSSERYPNSPMGATALVRQAFLDADWYERAQQAVSANSALPLPEYNVSLTALEAAVRARQPVVIDGTNELYALRAHRLASEFSLKLIVRGSGREYRQLAAIAATHRSFILPVSFPDAPKLDTEVDMVDASLQSLMHWRLAPQNPGRLEKAGVPFVLTTDGLDKATELLSKVRTAIEAGLSEKKALHALTLGPAELLDVDHLAGTLEAGKLANILVANGSLFDKKTNIEETWVQGQRYQFTPQAAIDIKGRWQLRSTDDPRELSLEIAGKPEKPSGKLGLASAFAKQPETEEKVETASTESPQKSVSKTDQPWELKELSFDGYRLTATFESAGVAGKPSGRAWLSLIVSATTEVAETIEGTIFWPNGSQSTFTGSRLPESESEATTEEKDTDKADTNQQESEADEKPSDESVAQLSKQEESLEVECEVNYPLGAYGRNAAPTQPKLLLIKNATLWTCAEAGILESTDLLIRDGIIAEIGKNLTVPADTTTIDATGLHVSPGIIDCHSHMATDGGVNESGQAVTAEVRIGDFIDSNDITIYRQLAGGVTTANILHGSANPIGGQNQVIKLRWGNLDEDLKMKEAPAGIKFALGENVKQSNRESAGTRYPQSRMGVEELMRDRFEAAKEYQQSWQAWRVGAAALPPRRDLELEAMAEILAGDRWVHCHSYRQDEILMVLRLLDEYNVTIGSLQHILEGYKVADAMAKHGATGSSFSDWWNYKIEVQDAIPFNGALMHRAGVIVSFNSDDAELARHLNHEAAKAVKYGGVDPSEALQFVTLNPAKQLRIDKWVGSLEPGKHADFVIWNRSPLSTLSMCQQTWIDGRKYFDREEDLVRREADERLRRALLQMAVAKGGAGRTDKDDKDPSMWWARYDEFCHHGHDEHDH